MNTVILSNKEMSLLVEALMLLHAHRIQSQGYVRTIAQTINMETLGMLMDKFRPLTDEPMILMKKIENIQGC